MSSFLDGPAKGVVLQLRRAPLFLRVVTNGKKWDALDQLSDTPARNEILFAYRLASIPITAHIRSRSGGGLFTMADYVAVPDPPSDATMRDREAWVQWCYAAASKFPDPRKSHVHKED